ncbi:MAG TPA: hypothetical protein PLN06_00450 [Bacteroidales bacterium]|nr:hypothetical protein [Bacteroidales bacterium]HCI56297.1 hypothetical protein [Bacteroidales bacterium]HOU95080.1 hypothetical protein [Bacteroidales bacterium]HQG36430.1 hypothetical protein [Bacteroidales bacterium]HQG53664.1 hypothetical protein [Bacteroidales bacterium]
MSEETKPATVKDDEIDLVDLFNRMGRATRKGFKSLGRAFLYCFFFLIKNWFWLGLSLALGVAGSYFLKYSSEKLYNSDITLRSNVIENADIIDYVNKLHTFCKERNMVELASALSVDSSKVRYIKDIQAFWVIDLGNDNIPDYVDFKNSHNPRDTINVRMPDRFVVRVKTSIPQELGEIRNGIISFIEKNQLFQQQNQLRLEQQRTLLSRIDYEIEQLDSLQKVKYFEESRRLMPKEGGQMIFLQEYKTQLLHDDIFNMYTRRQDVEKQLTIYSSLITVLNDFTPPAKPVNRALYYGKVLIPLLFCMAIIIILIVDNRERLKKIYRKY